MGEVGQPCTDGYRWGRVVAKEGNMIRVEWEYGLPDTTIYKTGWRPRETVRVVEGEGTDG